VKPAVRSSKLKAQSSKPLRRSGERGRWFWLLLLSFELGALNFAALASPIRVALMPFTTDDHSYRSWQGTADLTDAVLAGLGGVSGIEFVERVDLKLVEHERALAAAGLTEPGQLTGLERADWAVAVHFGEVRDNQRPWRIEVVELTRAQSLLVTNLDLAVPARSRLAAEPSLTSAITTQLRSALEVAVQAGDRNSRLRRAVWFNIAPPLPSAGWQMIDLGAAAIAKDEAELSIMGPTRSSGAQAFDFAEVFVWKTTNRTVEAWSPGGAARFPAGDVPAWNDLMLRLQPPSPAVEGVRAQIADALDRQGTAELFGLSSIEDAPSRERWRHGRALLSRALWLEPGRSRAREILLRAAYAPWVGRVSVHPLRWQRWRRDAWGEQVRRHGFATHSRGHVDEELEHGQFRGIDRTVAWEFAHSAYAVVRQYAPGAGFGPRDRWPSDLDSRVLQSWWARDLAELRSRLIQTADDSGLAELRAASANEVLVYGAGPDAAGWCRWFDDHAAQLRRESGPVWNEHPAEIAEQLRRLYAAADRVGQQRKVLATLTATESGAANRIASTTTPSASPAVTLKKEREKPHFHLPRISQLDSLAVRPALDAGNPELGPAPVPEAVRQLQAPALSGFVLPALPRLDEQWLLAAVSLEMTERAGQEPKLTLAPVQGNTLRLFRARGAGPFEPLPDHPLLAAAVGIVGHAGELWGWTTTEVWRIAVGGISPKPTHDGLTGPVTRLVSTAGQLFVAGQGIHRWLPAAGRWEAVIPQLPNRGPGSEVLLAGNQGVVWARRYQVMTVPSGGIPEALNPPWQQWRGGQWRPVPVPRVAELVLDFATNAWCADDGLLRWIAISGTNLWPSVQHRNPVVWRDPAALFQLGEPLPAYLRSADVPAGISYNERGFGQEFTDAELQALRDRLRRRPTPSGALRGDSRLNDPVTRLALVDDLLWIATDRRRAGKAPATRLQLLHAPTRRWIAAVDIPGPLKQWAVSPAGVLAVTGDIYGLRSEATLVHLVDIARLRGIPESAWLSPGPTPAELERAFVSLSPRERAIRAWAGGDPGLVQAFLADCDQESASAEDLFLLATAAATGGERQRALSLLRRDHAGSVFTAALTPNTSPKP
jgi:hypothetical protein